MSKAQKEHGFLKEIKTVSLFPFGKGGRIFDWLDVFPGEGRATEYYQRCFKAGYGDEKTPIRLQKMGDGMIPGIRDDNKSEVAKGLVAASPGAQVAFDEEQRDNSDIFGEKGFELRVSGGDNEVLDPDTTIHTHHFEQLDDFKFPQQFEEFEQFLDIFLEFAGPSKAGIISDTQALKGKAGQLSQFLRTYIQNDPEYKKAKSSPHFGYRHSMLVLEGLCFMEKFLVPALEK